MARFIYYVLVLCSRASNMTALEVGRRVIERARGNNLSLMDAGGVIDEHFERVGGLGSGVPLVLT